MTNEEKYNIVTRALYTIENCEHIFICNAIEAASKINVFKTIPELLEYKPEYKDKTSPWWPASIEGREKRVELLKKLQLRFKNE